MIYVLTSVNRDYEKFIKRYSESLLKTGAEIVPVFAVDSEAKYLKSIIESEFKETNLSPKIFFSKFIPSRFQIMKDLVKYLEDKERFDDYLTFIDIDDEVNETYFEWIKDKSLNTKSLVISNVVKHYEDSEFPYVAPNYLNFNPNDSYLSWGSLIWGKFYSLDLVKLFLNNSKRLDSSQRVYDYEHYCVYSLAILAKLSSEGVGFSKRSTYIWNRHSGSLMTMSISTVSKIVQSVFTLLPRNTECCIEAIYVSLLTSLASIPKTSDYDFDFRKIREALEEFKSTNLDVLNSTFGNPVYQGIASSLYTNQDGSANLGRFIIYNFLVSGEFDNEAFRYAFMSVDEVPLFNTGEFGKLHALIRFGHNFSDSRIFDIILNTDRRYLESGKVKFYFITDLEPLDLVSKLAKHSRSLKELNFVSNLIDGNILTKDSLSALEASLLPNDWIICTKDDKYVSINKKIEELSRSKCQD